MTDLDDTIAALASAPGVGLRGIIRLSGPSTSSLLQAWIPCPPESGWPRTSPARFAARLPIPDLRQPVPVDVQWWPTTRSYTGQPLAELHLVGSPPVLSAVLSECYRRGARPAGPGEFTLRAFLAGRLDLLQAEGVLGVIDAHNQDELQTALEQLAGGISARMLQMRNDLIELLSDLEAGLDFVEEHLEFVTRDEIRRRVLSAFDFVEELRRQSDSRMHAGERPKVVLAGLPNAGKSTLFNCLTAADLALVSPRAGTTRDYLAAVWPCDGLDVELVDTAGWESLEETASPALSQAMHAARAGQLRRASLLLWCSAVDATAADRELDTARYRDAQRLGVPCLRIGTKADEPELHPEVATDKQRPFDLMVSARTARGLPELSQLVRKQLTRDSARGQWLGMTSARCRESLRAAAESLSSAGSLASSPAGDELIAVELRAALDHLGAITGAVYTDDLLDRIFSKFCIGK